LISGDNTESSEGLGEATGSSLKEGKHKHEMRMVFACS